MSRIVSHTIFAAAAVIVGLSGMPRDARADGETAQPVTATGTEAAATAPAESEFKLLMVEQVGCVYCRMWEHDLGPIYPKTPEGQVAPLERVDLHKPFPEGITITKGKPLFTPTFILLRDGVEIDRIEGYASEDFFWGLLGQALQDAGADLPDPNG
ncbi:hypothetical protein [Thioclava pacifica]|uniref:SoxS protein n=1 Tax=Thioclava pacifica DSM 10166 TaxID=1353537 RepID=A0A074JIJ4_9RHOB|nr:hypothetical protein [Thioclava pacifica]KEO56294.1 hypothetical protein TP2_01855 [Thioclava pacifica DSM 10166]